MAAKFSRYAAFIRHGDYHQRTHAPSAFQPFALNKKGWGQAETVINDIQLFCQQFDVKIPVSLHSSSLLRAWQTAKIISKHLPVDSPNSSAKIIETVKLAERCVGNLANLTTLEITQVVKEDPRYNALPDNWKSDSDFCLPYPGAESLMMAGQRVADYANKMMAEDTAEKNALQLFIGHGAAFRHAAYHLGILERHKIATLSMYHCRPVFFKVHSPDQWQHIAGEWKNRQPLEHYTD